LRLEKRLASLLGDIVVNILDRKFQLAFSLQRLQLSQSLHSDRQRFISANP
jgi:hypothetical protein